MGSSAVYLARTSEFPDLTMPRCRDPPLAMLYGSLETAAQPPILALASSAREMALLAHRLLELTNRFDMRLWRPQPCSHGVY
jgi:hypothetical protein